MFRKLKKYLKNKKVSFDRKVSIQFNRLLSLICIFWAIPAILLIRVLRPWVYIRVGTFTSDRIGHFVDEAAQQWAEFSEKTSNQIDLYWLARRTINEQWTKMVRRNFKVTWWARYLDFWNNIIPGGKVHHRPLTLTSNRDKNGILNRTKKCMNFLPEEDQTAKDWLHKQGWQEGEPFVCLIVRDDAFLDSDLFFILDRGKWEYHTYRNSDITTYVPAMQWLADQGIWVFRMGKKMKKPLNIKHERIVDYAFHSERSAFLDIWLFAHCNLCISSGTGPDMVSSIYRRPLLFLNFIPLSHIWSWSNAIHVPKSLVWELSDKPLTWQEYLNHVYFKTNHYLQAGIKIVDLTPEEILYATQECWQRIDGSWMDTEEDLKNHQQFWNDLKQWPEFLKWHGWIHSDSRIGTTWLRAHKDTFFSKDKHSISSHT